MKKIFLCIVGVLGAYLLAACGKPKPVDPHADDVKVSIDESFRPIFEEELRCFQLENPEAVLCPSYVSEVDAINSLLNDSTRMIVVTRDLNEKERAYLTEKHQLVARSQRVATDAVALVVNPSNIDTLISLADVKRIVSGQITDWSQLRVHHRTGRLELVFDHPKSSTVRYLEDSLCGGKAMKGNLYATKSNEQVIEYVSKNPDAIGVVGVDWLRNNADSTRLQFLKKVHVMSVSRSAIPENTNSYEPYQYYIATGDYPLTRGVFMICTDPRERSIAKNFYFYVSDQKGQLIITRSSQLLPYMPVQIKNVQVTE